jgi:hypothetical protein
MGDKAKCAAARDIVVVSRYRRTKVKNPDRRFGHGQFGYADLWI